MLAQVSRTLNANFDYAFACAQQVRLGLKWCRVRWGCGHPLQPSFLFLIFTMPILKRPARAVGAEAFAITSSQQSANADPHTPDMSLPGVSNITEQIVARGLPVSAHAPRDDDGIVSDIPDEECDLDGCDDNVVDPVTDSEE
jgi:hypothetical protein